MRLNHAPLPSPSFLNSQCSTIVPVWSMTLMPLMFGGSAALDKFILALSDALFAARPYKQLSSRAYTNSELFASRPPLELPIAQETVDILPKWLRKNFQLENFTIPPCSLRISSKAPERITIPSMVFKCLSANRKSSLTKLYSNFFMKIYEIARKSNWFRFV